MKKVTITYSKELQDLIASDKHLFAGNKSPWRELPLMNHVHGLINYVHQVAMTGKMSKPLVPVITPGTKYPLLESLPDTQDSLTRLYEKYHSASRMEVQVYTGGWLDVCVRVDFSFYKTGKGNVPILTLGGGVDSYGIRLLKLHK